MNAENQQLTDERKNPLIHASVSSTLKPQTLQSVKIALSTKQNFAMAAEELFCHALNRTVWVYRKDYLAVDAFLEEIRNTAMESIATEQGIARITELVFGQGALREFLFTLRVQFYSQFSEFNTLWAELIENIALSLTNEPLSEEAKPEMSLVPEDLRIRTHSTQHMRDLMLANSWLVMFILTALWGRTFTYEELRANYRRSGTASYIGG